MSEQEMKMVVPQEGDVDDEDKANGARLPSPEAVDGIVAHLDGPRPTSRKAVPRAPTAQGEAIKTPLRSIRAKCLDCAAGNDAVVRRCPLDGQRDRLCAFYSFRVGKGTGRGGLLRAIRQYCLWCCNGQRNEVKLCPSTNCAIWPYRFGKRP